MSLILTIKSLLTSPQSGRQQVIINPDISVYILKNNVAIQNAQLILDKPSYRVRFYNYKKPMMIVDFDTKTIKVLRYTQDQTFRMEVLDHLMTKDIFILNDLFLKYIPIFNEDMGVFKIDKLLKDI